MTADTVFVGDSITAQGDWQQRYPNSDVKVFAIPGCRVSAGVQLSELAVTLKPKKVFLLIGVNNVSDYNYLNTLQRDYGELLQNLVKTDAKIYVESILPVCSPSGVSNDRINSANQVLKELAEEYHCVFIDTHEAFLDSLGEKMDPALTKDGVHLNDQGYERLYQLLDQYIIGD